MKPLQFGKWPSYSPACQRDVVALLRAGGSLTAYRSNPDFPYGPRRGSWAWKAERLAERLFGIQHAVICNSGTMALQAGLWALDVPKGSEVITTPFTFSATPAAVLHAGLQPVFADVHPGTFCLTPDSVGRVASDKGTRATLPVDLFGRPTNWWNYFNSPILEDACQAVGAYAGGLWAGRLGAIATYSFNGQKNVPAGEAGMAVTQAGDLAKRLRRFVSHGENWSHLEVGLNGRVNEVTACIAYHGLLAVKTRNTQRRHLAMELWRRLKDESRVRVLPPQEILGHALYVYPLVLRGGVDRAAFCQRLKTMGVATSAGYIRPHLGHYPAFTSAVRGPLPVVEELSESTLVLLLQIRPPATRVHMRYIAGAIKVALDGGKSARRAEVGRVDASAF